MSTFRKKAAQLGALMNHVPTRPSQATSERLLVKVRMEPASRQRALEILAKSRVCLDQKTVFVTDRGGDSTEAHPVTTWFDLAWNDMRYRTKTWNAREIFPSELSVKTILGLAKGEDGQSSAARPPYQAGIVAQSLLTNFYSSADGYPDVRHLPRGYRDEPTGSYGARIGLQAIELAQAAWKTECSVSSSVVSKKGIVKMWLSMGRASDYSCVVVPHGEELSPAHIAWLESIEATLIICDDPVPRAACSSAQVNRAFKHLVQEAVVYDGMIHEEVSPGIAMAVGQVQCRLTGEEQSGETVAAFRREKDDVGHGVCDDIGTTPPSIISITESGRLRDALRCASVGQSALLPNTREVRNSMATLKGFNRLIHHKREGGGTPAPESSFIRRFPNIAEAKKRTANDPLARELLELAIDLNNPAIESDLELLEYLITDGEQVKNTPAMHPVELYTLHELEQSQTVLTSAQLGTEFESSQPVAGIYQDLALYKTLQHISHDVYASPSVLARLALYGEKGLEVYRANAPGDIGAARSPTASEDQLAFFREEMARRLSGRRGSHGAADGPDTKAGQAQEEIKEHDEHAMSTDAEPVHEASMHEGSGLGGVSQRCYDSQANAFSAADIVDRAAQKLTPEEARSAFQAFRSGGKTRPEGHDPIATAPTPDAGPNF